MGNRPITDAEKRAFLRALETDGTIKRAAEMVGVTEYKVRSEKKRSDIFRRKVDEAKREGLSASADRCVGRLIDIAEGKLKSDKAMLTANIALANAYAEGFKGTTRVEQHVEGEIRVVTAVPRPQYIDVPKPKKLKHPDIIEGEFKEAE